MREKRGFVLGLEPLRGPRQGLADIAFACLHVAPVGARRIEVAAELRVDVVLGDRLATVTGPLHIERRQAPLGMPVAVRYDRDGVRQGNDSLDARHRHGARVVDAEQATAEDRRSAYRRDLHAVDVRVDAEPGAAVDLGRNVQARFRPSHHLELVSLLQPRLRRRDQLGGRCREIGEPRFAPRRRVFDQAPFQTQFAHRNLPSRGRGFRKDLSGRRARHAHGMHTG